MFARLLVFISFAALANNASAAKLAPSPAATKNSANREGKQAPSLPASSRAILTLEDELEAARLNPAGQKDLFREDLQLSSGDRELEAEKFPLGPGNEVD